MVDDKLTELYWGNMKVSFVTDEYTRDESEAIKKAINTLSKKDNLNIRLPQHPDSQLFIYKAKSESDKRVVNVAILKYYEAQIPILPPHDTTLSGLYMEIYESLKRLPLQRQRNEIYLNQTYDTIQRHDLNLRVANNIYPIQDVENAVQWFENEYPGVLQLPLPGSMLTFAVASTDHKVTTQSAILDFPSDTTVSVINLGKGAWTKEGTIKNLLKLAGNHLFIRSTPDRRTQVGVSEKVTSKLMVDAYQARS